MIEDKTYINFLEKESKGGDFTNLYAINIPVLEEYLASRDVFRVDLEDEEKSEGKDEEEKKADSPKEENGKVEEAKSSEVKPEEETKK